MPNCWFVFSATPSPYVGQPGTVIVIVCPGQGSQTPGFLAPWLDIPEFRARFETLSEASGTDLLAHGTTSDAETIKDTAVAQPLIVAAGLATISTLFPDHDLSAVGAVAGHSVGEITAAGAAGVFTDAQAMSFVSTRGRAMAQASAIQATGMSAVVGGHPAEVLATLEDYGLTPANMNGAGQIVAAGTAAQLRQLAEDPPAKARVMPLSVAGAFHTEHMAPAVDVLAALAGTMTVADPQVTLLSNLDGQSVASGTGMLDRLVRQVSSPVRWDQCMQAMVDAGASALIELPPAGTLANLAKRGMRGVTTLAVKTPDDLETARALLTEHGQA